jgi:hypothetical protein
VPDKKALKNVIKKDRPNIFIPAVLLLLLHKKLIKGVFFVV